MIERRFSAAVTQRKIGTVLQQPLRDLQVAKRGSKRESGCPVAVEDIDIGTGIHEFFGDVFIALKTNTHQGRVAGRVPCVDIGAVGQQEVHDGRLLVIRSQDQRCKAFCIDGIDNPRICSKQLLHNRQIATAAGIKKFGIWHDRLFFRDVKIAVTGKIFHPFKTEDKGLFRTKETASC